MVDGVKFDKSENDDVYGAGMLTMGHEWDDFGIDASAEGGQVKIPDSWFDIPVEVGVFSSTSASKK